MKHYVNFTLLLSFVVLISSALLRFFQPFSLATTRVHIVFGFLVFITVALHLLARLHYFTKMLRADKNGSRRKSNGISLLIIPLIFCGYFLGACVWSWWPVPQLLSWSYEVRNTSIIFRPEDDVHTRHLIDQTQIKKSTTDKSSVFVEIEWGSSYDPVARFPTPFSGARPQIAVWAESSVGSLIETFFVSEESAFNESFSWGENQRNRVDILPIWRHQFTLASGVEPNGDIDTFSGATPEHSFSVEKYIDEDPEGFYICVEVNIPDDGNGFYNSDQQENNEGYTLPGVGQPSIYFSTFVDPSESKKYYLMDYVGHGGSKNQQAGEIYYDSSQITSAHNIIEKVLIRIQRP